MTASVDTGFIGLGTMGAPMALNLLRAGTPLVVWNRSDKRSAALAQAGALVASKPEEVFARCKTVLMMLADEAATDAVLGRGTPDFASRVAGRMIVAMSTHSPGYSQILSAEIRSVDGCYVEAPVSVHASLQKPGSSYQCLPEIRKTLPR